MITHLTVGFTLAAAVSLPGFSQDTNNAQNSQPPEQAQPVIGSIPAEVIHSFDAFGHACVLRVVGRPTLHSGCSAGREKTASELAAEIIHTQSVETVEESSSKRCPSGFTGHPDMRGVIWCMDSAGRNYTPENAEYFSTHAQPDAIAEGHRSFWRKFLFWNKSRKSHSIPQKNSI